MGCIPTISGVCADAQGVGIHPMVGIRIRRYGSFDSNNPSKNMSYPMNKFTTGINPLCSVTERGKNLYKTVRKRVGNDASSANAIIQRNPYKTGMIGISVIALLGYLFACRRHGRFI